MIIPRVHSKRISLTPELLKLLKSEQKRTSTGAINLLAKASSPIPSGLTTGIVNSWLYGHVQSAKKGNIDFVLECWAKLPTIKRAKISSKIREKLISERHRTNTTPSQLLRHSEDVPAGLSSDMVSAWLSGLAASAREDYLIYVLKKWEDLANSPTPFEGSKPRRKLTASLLKQIKNELHRTRIVPGRVFNAHKEKVPSGLTGYIISQWILGKHKTVRSDHLECFFQLYGAIPDFDDSYFEMTKARKNKIRSEIKRTGQSVRKLFENRTDCPDGFNWEHINRFISNNSRVRQDIYAYILKVCHEAEIGYIKLTKTMIDALKREIKRTNCPVSKVFREI